MFRISFHGLGCTVDNPHIIFIGKFCKFLCRRTVQRFCILYRHLVYFRIRIIGIRISRYTHFREQKNFNPFLMCFFHIRNHTFYVRFFISPFRSKVYHSQLILCKFITDFRLFFSCQSCPLCPCPIFGKCHYRYRYGHHCGHAERYCSFQKTIF